MSNLFSHIPRHLYSIHGDEELVIQITSTHDPAKKKLLISKLRNFGNYKHNTKVLAQGSGEVAAVVPLIHPLLMVTTYLVSISIAHMPVLRCDGMQIDVISNRNLTSLALGLFVLVTLCYRIA